MHAWHARVLCEFFALFLSKSVRSSDIIMKCIKCDSSSSVVLRKKDNYCNNCFLMSTNHKFRACIGKNKILSKNDKVMLCLSGGPASTVLLDLVHHGISLDIHKKLRIIPYILHITGLNDCSVADSIKKQCEKNHFDVYFIHISDYLQQNRTLPKVSHIPENAKENDEFQAILNNMPATAYNDFLSKVKKSLFIKYANLMECKYVFTAETTSTLAINLLSNIAIGRGSQVQNDIGFIDARDENVQILRPMKDISKEELEHYINIKGLAPAELNDVRNNSLQIAISGFVTELQENFQSTISAVCRTADKIGVAENSYDKLKKCAICESYLNKANDKLTALDATMFSRTVSFGKASRDNIEDDTLFPLIDQHLCYSCSRNYSEMNCKLPHLDHFVKQ